MVTRAVAECSSAGSGCAQLRSAAQASATGPALPSQPLADSKAESPGAESCLLCTSVEPTSPWKIPFHDFELCNGSKYHNL